MHSREFLYVLLLILEFRAKIQYLSPYTFVEMVFLVIYKHCSTSPPTPKRPEAVSYSFKMCYQNINLHLCTHFTYNPFTTFATPSALCHYPNPALVYLTMVCPSCAALHSPHLCSFLAPKKAATPSPPLVFPMSVFVRKFQQSLFPEPFLHLLIY